MLYAVIYGIHSVLSMMLAIGAIGWLFATSNKHQRIFSYMFYIGLFGSIFLVPIVNQLEVK